MPKKENPKLFVTRPIVVGVFPNPPIEYNQGFLRCCVQNHRLMCCCRRRRTAVKMKLEFSTVIIIRLDGIASRGKYLGESKGSRIGPEEQVSYMVGNVRGFSAGTFVTLTSGHGVFQWTKRLGGRQAKKQKKATGYSCIVNEVPSHRMIMGKRVRILNRVHDYRLY